MEKVPCTPSEDCKYRETGCREDTHHIYYPRHAYKDSVSRAFRELAVNKVVVCRSVHDEIHADPTVPKKPTRNEMLQVLDGR